MSKENLLPLKVDPFRFADHGIQLQGTLPIKGMKRLCTSLANDSGKVEVESQFGIDEQKTRFLKGKLVTCVQLVCQRCMEVYPFEIRHGFSLGIVETEEQANQLPSAYDPVIVKESTLWIQEVIEDELIIMLPIVPMHREKDCKLKLPLVIGSKQDPEIMKENPFKVIESLLTQRPSKK